MTETTIFECPKCGGLLLASTNQKTRTCPYCGGRVDLQKAKRLAKADSAMEASAMLRKIKAEKQDNAHKPQQKV